MQERTFEFENVVFRALSSFRILFFKLSQRTIGIEIRYLEHFPRDLFVTFLRARHSLGKETSICIEDFGSLEASELFHRRKVFLPVVALNLSV